MLKVLSTPVASITSSFAIGRRKESISSGASGPGIIASRSTFSCLDRTSGGRLRLTAIIAQQSWFPLYVTKHLVSKYCPIKIEFYTLFKNLETIHGESERVRILIFISC